MFSRKAFSMRDVTSDEGVEIEIDLDREQSSDEDCFDEEVYKTFVEDISDPERIIQSKFIGSEFSKSKLEMTPLTEDGKVLKKIIKSGTGLPIPDKAVVLCHYEGYLDKSSDPFDSTRLRHKPFKFLIGHSSIVEGLKLGIESMKKEEKAFILVSPDYGYGPMGCPPRIPGNVEILYEVEILNFYESKDAIELEEMVPEDQRRAPFEKIEAAYRCEKEMANDLFSKKLYKQAIARYRKTVKLLESVSVANEEEDVRRQDCLLKLYLNLSQCYLNETNFDKAVVYANLVLKQDPKNGKALYRMGTGLTFRGDYDSGEKYLRLAKQERPFDRDIDNMLNKLREKRKQHENYEKLLCRRMFGTSKPDMRMCDMPEYQDYAKTMREQFAKFQSSDEEELVFSPGCTEDQLDIIQELARELNLAYVSRILNGEKISKVAKRKKNNE